MAFYAATFPEQRLETIRVLGRTMQCQVAHDVWTHRDAGVLHCLNLGIGQEFEELGTTSVQAGTDLAYGFNHGHAVVVSVNDQAA